MQPAGKRALLGVLLLLELLKGRSLHRPRDGTASSVHSAADLYCSRETAYLSSKFRGGSEELHILNEMAGALSSTLDLDTLL